MPDPLPIFGVGSGNENVTGANLIFSGCGFKPLCCVQNIYKNVYLPLATYTWRIMAD